MKTKLLLLTLCVIYLLSSCDKNLYDSNQSKDITRVTDIIIPKEFNWKMTRSIETTIASQFETQIALYVDKECTDRSQIASFIVSPSKRKVLTVSIPTYAEFIYIKYINSDNTPIIERIPINENQLLFNVPSNKKKKSSGSKKELNQPAFGANNNVICYPYRNNWGTIMFEDMFPLKGDYDFNDIVVQYKTLLYLNSSDYQKVDAINLSLRIRALGGDKEFYFFLHLNDIMCNNIESIQEIENSNGRHDNINLLGDERSYEPIIFSFKGLTKGIKEKQTAKYYNTIKSSIDHTPNIYNVIIKFKQPVELSKLNSDNFDYFIANNNMKGQIHLSGYKPIYEDYPSNMNLSQSTLYTSELGPMFSTSGLAWAFNVPYEVAHVEEGTDFSSAYPRFVGWVTGNGKNCNDWYKNDNPNSPDWGKPMSPHLIQL